MQPVKLKVWKEKEKKILTDSATPNEPKMASISSRVSRFVSGTQSHTKTPPAKVKMP